MGSLTKDDQRLIAGSHARREAILRGENWERVIHGGNRTEYRLKRVEDVEMPAVGVTLAVVANAYEIAKVGGDDTGHYQRYKNEYSSRLLRAARSYEKFIQVHREWVEHPEIKLGTDVDKDILRRCVEKKWPEDIARSQANLYIINGILMERSS